MATLHIRLIESVPRVQSVTVALGDLSALVEPDVASRDQVAAALREERLEPRFE